MKIALFALRRSGSTAIWSLFNSHPDVVAYDEPFNPKLRLLPESHHKGTWDTFIEKYNNDPSKYEYYFAPIQKNEELKEGLSEDQTKYIGFLTEGVNHWFMDLTRAHLKARDISILFEDAYIIHMYRNPVSFVSSHMLPSYGGWKSKINRKLNAALFWVRRSGFDGWSAETICRSWGKGADPICQQLALNSDFLVTGYAIETLLTYWLMHYRYMEKLIKPVAGEKYLSIELERFCNKPEETLRLFASDIDYRKYDLSLVRQPSAGRSKKDFRWLQAMQKVGFSDDEISQFYGPY